MQQIGTIKLLQIQKKSLKIGVRPNSGYDPSALVQVPQALVSNEGVIGLTDDLTHLVDVHHKLHISQKFKWVDDMSNGIAVGFTSHYDAQRATYGAHVVNGVGGENIIIETDRQYLDGVFNDDLYIQSAALDMLFKCHVPGIVPPCVEYAGFCANQVERLSEDAMKRTLQDLGNGKRGYYLNFVDRQEPITLAVGDAVFMG